ncbi:MAG: 50S ribosomal protein L18Ae [Acidilobaceae archaeon]|nr:50S ribosomal protein L18Ae [Acidilobaceae archaeon]MCX8165521.1 50S ribosomal protein L18Ae [Acidilobaceae archaeon]MDW7973948.1 50S ribosomal protein L18Ae [Sulfolobales archaeon]
MSEVKVFLVRGYMLISHDRAPERRKFELYVRTTRPEAALEKVYSLLGSRHKLRRDHIRVESIQEVNPEEVDDMKVLKLSSLERVVK